MVKKRAKGKSSGEEETTKDQYQQEEKKKGRRAAGNKRKRKEAAPFPAENNLREGIEAAPAEKKQRKGKEVVKSTETRWPARERRQVVRFSDPAKPKVLSPKIPTIEQGPGSKLRDIPNVLFKLSKRKADDNLNLLHTIIFGRKSNVRFLKRNILQFSGYIWSGDEEKQRAKVQGKIDKCTKVKLVDFCQLFDISLNKAIIKKEEASAKLLDFLESPRVTRDAILAQKLQQGKKQTITKEVKQKTSKGASSDGGSKRHKGTSGSKINRGRTPSSESDEDAGDETEKGKTEDQEDKPEESVRRKKNPEKSTTVGASKMKKKPSPMRKGKIEHKEDKIKKSIPRKDSSGKRNELGVSKMKEQPSSTSTRKGTSPESGRSATKSVKVSSSKEGTMAPARSKKVSFSDTSTKGSKVVTKAKAALPRKDSVKVAKKVSKSSRRSASTNDNDSGHPSTSTIKKEDKRKGRSSKKPSAENKHASRRPATETISKITSKEKGKGKAGRKAIKVPSREEMLSVASEILKDVDFDAVTLNDILKQLESHFNVKLMDRKEDVKSVIEEVIKNMSDSEDDDGIAEDGEGGNDEVGPDEDQEEEEEKTENGEGGDDEERSGGDPAEEPDAEERSDGDN